MSLKVSETNPFRDYYDRKTDEIKRVIKSKIIFHCEISESSFHRKLRSNTWSVLEQREICRICEIEQEKYFPYKEIKIN